MATLPDRDDLLRCTAQRAATSPPSLFLGSAGLLLLLSPATWPAGIASFLLQGVWLWTRIRNEDYVRESGQLLLHQHRRRLVERLDELSGGLDRETAARLSAITEAHERLSSLAPRAAHSLLPASQVEMISLLEHCVSLVGRREHVRRYLASANTGELQRQARDIQHRLDEAEDAAVRRVLAQALSQKQQALENYVRVEETARRMDSHLLAVQSTFDNLLSRAVRLQAGPEPLPPLEADPLFEEITRLTRGVAELDASLEETLQEEGVV
ncbi:MAG: hypothetical protein FJX77_07630 [Armatimonadetes bacterium]|nr:hypothetical protein [Armatimonadota bacterium]